MTTSITRRGDRGLGKTVSGGNAGSFAGHQRAMAAAPGVAVSTRYEHLTPEEEQRIHTELSEAIPEFGDALQAPEGSFPRTAASTAAQWRQRGEPLNVVQQVFDHERLHYLPTNFGPSRRRRRCPTCGEFVEKGAGAEYGSSPDRVQSAHEACLPERFRPPMPEPTVMSGEISVTDLTAKEASNRYTVEISPGGGMGMRPYTVTVNADTAAKARAVAKKSAPKYSTIGSVTKVG